MGISIECVLTSRTIMGCLKPNSMPYETSRGTNNAVKGHTRSPLDPLRTPKIPPNVPSKPPKTQHYPASCPIISLVLSKWSNVHWNRQNSSEFISSGRSPFPVLMLCSHNWQLQIDIINQLSWITMLIMIFDCFGPQKVLHWVYKCT